MKFISLTVLVGISVAIVAGALYIFALFDMERRIALINTYQAEIVSKEGETSSFARLATLVDETKEDRDRLSTYIVSTDGVVGLLKEIESLASTSRATITIVSVAEEKIPGEERGIFEEVNIAMSVSGSYSEVRHAIALLEVLPYPTKINQIRLESRLEDKKTVWSVPLMLSVLKDI